MLALFAVAMLFMPALPVPGAADSLGEVYAALPASSAGRRVALLGTTDGSEAATGNSSEEWSAQWGENATALVLEPGSHAANVALQHLQVCVEVREWMHVMLLWMYPVMP